MQIHYWNADDKVVHYVADDATMAAHCRNLAAEAKLEHWRTYWLREAVQFDDGVLARSRLAQGLRPARAEDCACFHGRGCAPIA